MVPRADAVVEVYDLVQVLNVSRARVRSLSFLLLQLFPPPPFVELFFNLPPGVLMAARVGRSSCSVWHLAP